jgi:competence protein ComFC
MKFNSRPNYGRQMAVYIAQDIKRYYNDVEFNMITSVPLYRAQLFDRGYNQSRILAREIGRILSLPYEDVLIKYRNNKRQYTLKAKERAKNVARVYKVADKSLIKDKNILIIDDVITTGCTLGACSKVLFKGGANLVCTATFCCTEIK